MQAVFKWPMLRHPRFSGVCGRRRPCLQSVAFGELSDATVTKTNVFRSRRHAHLVELRGVLEHLVDVRVRRVRHSRALLRPLASHERADIDASALPVIFLRHIHVNADGCGSF